MKNVAETGCALGRGGRGEGGCMSEARKRDTATSNMKKQTFLVAQTTNRHVRSRSGDYLRILKGYQTRGEN